MLKNKRILKLLVVLIMLVLGMALLTGCGEKSQNKDSEKESVSNQYEEPLKNYFKGMENADVKMYLKSYPDFMDMNDYIDDDDMKEMLESFEDEYGKNIKITYKITKKEELKKDELENVQKYIIEKYDEEINISEGYLLKVNATIKGDTDEDTDTTKMYVYKIDDEFKFLSVSPETAKSYID